MSLFPADMRAWISGSFDALLDYLAKASPPIEQIRSSDGKFVHWLVREGYKIETKNGPRKKQRGHVFEDVASLASWLNKWGDPKLVEVLVAATQIEASLDPKDPHGDLVTCGMLLHPRARRWYNAMKKGAIAQSDLHRLCMTSLDDFERAKDQSGADLGSYGSILAGEIQKLSVAHEGSVEVRLDSTGVVRFAGSSDDVKVNGKLPPKFRVRVPWFLGVQSVDGKEIGEECEYWVEIFLRLHTPRDSAPYFEIDAPGLDLVVRQATLDASEYLDALLDDGFLVGLGSYHAPEVADLASE